MKKMIALCTTIMLLGASCAPHHDASSSQKIAQKKGEFDYPTIKELYDDCKEQVDHYDEHEFLRSRCGMMINGVFTSQEVTLYAVAPLMKSDRHRIQNIYYCNYKDKSLMEKYKALLQDSEKEYPIEYFIAQDFISHIKLRMQKSSHEFLKSLRGWGLGQIFHEMLITHCKS